MHLSNISFDRMGKHVPRVVLAAGSEPDENGMISLGVAPFDLRLLDVCETVIIQVNRHMPYVFGEGCLIPAERVSALVEMEEALPEMRLAPPSEEQRRIAGYIAEQVPDGACLQIGIGGVSAALGEALMGKRDLGCHSEMFTDPIMELMRSGAVNNSRKSYCPGKSVFTNALGSSALYAFMDRNPAIEAQPCALLNDPRNIARNDNMISVSGALCCDLTGQVCAESIGFRQFSGTGGQLDYVRGARWSKGGKSFLTVPSVHADRAGNRSSNIALTLPAGSAVTTPRADVHYIVTEYGAADLLDEPIDVRAKRLIEIAHPDYRDQLLFEAKKAGYII
jgi:4-hydroxybutyrate CoA-transferase